MGLTKKQHQILADNFTAEQVEILIPIIEMMQSEYDFELGVQTLKGVGLYDVYVTFLRQHTWHLYMKDEFILKYSVMKELELRNWENFMEKMLRGRFKCFSNVEDEYIAHIMEAPNWLHSDLNDEVGLFKLKNCNILLPLFSKKLNIVSNLRIEIPINILNFNKIDYPITLDCNIRNLKTIPDNISVIKLKDVGITDMKKLLKSKTHSLIDLSIDFAYLYKLRTSLDKTLLSFPNLQSLTISNIEYMEDVFFVPHSVTNLTMEFYGVWQHLHASIKKVICALSNNPSIQNLRVLQQDVTPRHTITDIDKEFAVRLTNECGKLGFTLVGNHHIGDLHFYRNF